MYAHIFKGAPMGNDNATGPHNMGRGKSGPDAWDRSAAEHHAETGKGIMSIGPRTGGEAIHVERAKAHNQATDYHDQQQEHHQTRYTETEGTVSDNHKAAAAAHGYASDMHRGAAAKNAISPVGNKSHESDYAKASGKALAASVNAAQWTKDGRKTAVTKGAPIGNDNARGPHAPFTHSGSSSPAKHTASKPTGSGSFSTHSEAMSQAHDYIKSKGYEISDDNWQHHVSGKAKPGEGKTNKYDIPLDKDGQETDKYAHIQIYNKGNEVAQNYELNAYVDSGKPKIAKTEGGFSGVFKGAPMGNRNAAGHHTRMAGAHRKGFEQHSQASKDFPKSKEQHDAAAKAHLEALSAHRDAAKTGTPEASAAAEDLTHKTKGPTRLAIATLPKGKAMTPYTRAG